MQVPLEDKPVQEDSAKLPSDEDKQVSIYELTGEEPSVPFWKLTW